MKALLQEHPEYKVLGKRKFVQVVAAHGVSKAEAGRFYDTLELGQVYRPKKRKGALVITAPPYSFQIDVFELPKYKSRNRGVYRVFLAVDILSRKAFAYPLKDGSMEAVLKVYEKFLIDVDEQVNSVAGDAFFDNATFRTFNDELKINVFTDVAKNDHITSQGNKLGIVDRATRTLKKLIAKWMLAHDTAKWTAFLPKVLKLYNNSPHSAHPNEATPEEVFDDYGYMEALYEAQRAKNRAVDMEFKPGDRVRLQEGRGTFEKEKATYSRAIYTVERQVGYRFEIRGKEVLKRLYRPSELQKVEGEVAERLQGRRKVQAERQHKRVRDVAKALRQPEVKAEQAIAAVEEPRGKRERRPGVQQQQEQRFLELVKMRKPRAAPPKPPRRSGARKPKVRPPSAVERLLEWREVDGKMWYVVQVAGEEEPQLVPSKELQDEMGQTEFKRLRSEMANPPPARRSGKRKKKAES